MKLIKIRSLKHKGAIFLRDRDRASIFVCKIYPNTTANYVADTIIRALENIPLGEKQNELPTSKTS